MARFPRLRLEVRACVACGICMDSCPTGAIGMRQPPGVDLAGRQRLLHHLGTVQAPERAPQPTMTYPWLTHPERCEPCGMCERACPTSALEVRAWPDPDPATEVRP